MSNSNSKNQTLFSLLERSEKKNTYLFDGVYQVVALDKKAAADLIYEDLDIRIPSADIQKRIKFKAEVTRG
jgi:hypothetical protein